MHLSHMLCSQNLCILCAQFCVHKLLQLHSRYEQLEAVSQQLASVNQQVKEERLQFRKVSNTALPALGSAVGMHARQILCFCIGMAWQDNAHHHVLVKMQAQLSCLAAHACVRMDLHFIDRRAVSNACLCKQVKAQHTSLTSIVCELTHAKISMCNLCWIVTSRLTGADSYRNFCAQHNALPEDHACSHMRRTRSIWKMRCWSWRVTTCSWLSSCKCLLGSCRLNQWLCCAHCIMIHRRQR